MEHFWCMNEAQTHKTHHGLDLGEATTFLLIVLSMSSHGANTQMSFYIGTPKLGVLKFPKLGLSRLWGPLTHYENFWLKWCLNNNYSPCRNFSNDMSLATCTQGNQSDFKLLMVGSQISNLTPNLSFGHNLCF